MSYLCYTKLDSSRIYPVSNSTDRSTPPAPTQTEQQLRTLVTTVLQASPSLPKPVTPNYPRNLRPVPQPTWGSMHPNSQKNHDQKRMNALTTLLEQASEGGTGRKAVHEVVHEKREELHALAKRSSNETIQGGILALMEAVEPKNAHAVAAAPQPPVTKPVDVLPLVARDNAAAGIAAMQKTVAIPLFAESAGPGPLPN